METNVMELIEKADNQSDLDLSNKQLTSLPPEIGELTNLANLDLSRNQLTSLPPEIGKLTNLIRLNLSRNQLTSLPPEIGKLRNLKYLYLGINQLASLPPEIGDLTNLNELTLGSNELTSLPPETGKLTNLTNLNLGINQLTSLPLEIGKLTNLTKLYLNENQLASLPPEIGKLTNLAELNVYGNPLITPPPEIVKKGIDGILDFLSGGRAGSWGGDYVKQYEIAQADKRTFIQKLEAAKGDDVFKYLLLINTSALEGYIAQTRHQADQSFQLSQKVAVVGFVLITLGIVIGYYSNITGKSSFETAYLSSIAGILTEFISGVFFYLYNKTLPIVLKCDT